MWICWETGAQDDREVYSKYYHSFYFFWDGPYVISDTEVDAGRPAMCVTDNGWIHCVYHGDHDPTGAYEIAYANHTGDAFTSWQWHEIVSTNEDEGMFPTIVADGNDVWVAYQRFWQDSNQELNLTHGIWDDSIDSMTWWHADEIKLITQSESDWFFGSMFPDSQSKIHIAYPGGDNDLAYRVFDPAVNDFTSEEEIIDEHPQDGECYSPSLVVDSNDEVHIVYPYSYFSGEPGNLGTANYVHGNLGNWSQPQFLQYWNGIVDSFNTFPVIGIDGSNDLWVTYTNIKGVEAPGDGYACLTLMQKNASDEGWEEYLISQPPVGDGVPDWGAQFIHDEVPSTATITHKVPASGPCMAFSHFSEITLTSSVFAVVPTLSPNYTSDIENYPESVSAELTLGNSTMTEVTISNVGERDLIIYSIDENVHWLTTEIEEDLIPPNESTIMTVTFWADSLELGTHNGNIMISNNDRDESYLRLDATLTVEESYMLMYPQACSEFVMPDQEVDVAIEFETEIPVGSIGFQLNFDPNILFAVDAEAGDFFPGAFVENTTIDNETGFVSYLINHQDGVIADSATVCHIAMQVKSDAETEVGTFLTLSEVFVIDYQGIELGVPVGDEMLYVAELIIYYWPGDTDNDGLVNETDVLPVGMYYGYTGQGHGYNFNWEGHPVIPWEPIEATFVDPDGNGMVNQNDLFAVSENFGQTHDTFSPKENIAVDSILVPILDVGHHFSLIINLASEEYPIEDFLGVASYFNIPPEFEILDVRQGDWLGNSFLISFEKKDNTTGDLYCAFTRKNTNPVDRGYGEAIIVDLKVTQEMDEPAEILLHRGTTSSINGYDYQPAVNLILSGVTHVENQTISEIPTRYSLYPNYPNPFNPATTIQFKIPVASQRAVKLQIYDVSGKLIKTLVDEPIEAGYHSVVWNGKDDSGQEIASGLYFYKIESENFSQTKRCLLLK